MTSPGNPTEWSVRQFTPTELLDWIHAHRYLRDFTCSERTLYQIEPLCSETGGSS
jgi:hypothetical protein